MVPLDSSRQTEGHVYSLSEDTISSTKENNFNQHWPSEAHVTVAIGLHS